MYRGSLLSRGLALDNLEQISALLSKRPVGLISDLDGTLSEIVPVPDEARVSPSMRKTLEDLQRSLALVAVVTGRPVRQAQGIIGLPQITYIGNHGMERFVKGELSLDEGALAFAPFLDRLFFNLKTQFTTAGLVFESKGGSFAVHYRLTANPEKARDALLDTIQEMAGGQVRVLMGKTVINVLPPVDLNKGTAVTSLVAESGLSAVLLLGDDVTDVDAFRAARRLSDGGGLSSTSIAVLGEETPPGLLEQADFTLPGVTEVEEFLRWVVEQTM